ncbi:hypothetical protein [Silvimonas soli]|uniref:hypothetical protein n=1 Tax=Silvimonas soli TaxID=2980100 RepID=UPI0024B3AE83|nr:hypothetical protein [Silvimonas soli]
MDRLNELPINTDIPPYGADDQTEQSWRWLQAVGQLVAAELVQQPRGTLALVEETDCVYWVLALGEQVYLATAPIHDGEIMLQHGALLQGLIGVSVEELVYRRMALENWLLAQPTMRIGEPKRLQLWSEVPKQGEWDSN